MEHLLSILAYAACPLMMLFCMKGMFGGKKECHPNRTSNDLTTKMESLEQQNLQLLKEIEEIRKQSEPKVSNL